MATKDERYTSIAPGIVKVFRRGRFVGYRASVWVRDLTRPRGGKLVPKRFPKTATLTEMKDWRVDERRLAKLTPQPLPEVRGTGFAGDAATYLDAVTAMPTFKERQRHIQEWVTLFGETPRADIKASAIRAQRDRWLTHGPKMVLQQGRWTAKAIPLSASAVNHRLRALENLWTVLDGRHAYNPVREVEEATEPDPQPRGATFATALEVLSFMPDLTKAIKGRARDKGSLSRVRFEAMLWTGLPAVQLGRLALDSVDWVNSTVVVPRRQKGRRSRRAGRRTPNVARPLLPQAVTALKRLFALGANRPFSSSSLGQSVRRAIRAANVQRAKQRRPLIPETLTVYQLTRHTFAFEVYEATRNITTVKNLLGHRDVSMSERYAKRSVDSHVAADVRRLGTRARSAQSKQRRLS